jgi:hypothetical protein
MVGGKLGQAIAELFWETISPDFKKEIEQVKDDVITVTIEEYIGLDIAPKLFVVCGDNALNNNTFCDYLYERLLQDYNDNPTS